jgi:DNA replication protein DnaC
MNPPHILEHLSYLQLSFFKEHYPAAAAQAAQHHWAHLQYLEHLAQGEFDLRRQRSIQRRIKDARFPVLKSLEQFRWDWPKKRSTASKSKTSSAFSLSKTKPTSSFWAPSALELCRVPDYAGWREVSL